MKVELKVEHSIDIKRKKPWPEIKWLGDKCEDVFVLDGQRASTLFLKNGETKKKIPKLQPQLDSTTAIATSRNGAFLVGLQKNGKLFLWHKDTELLRHISGIPDVYSSTLVTAADKEVRGGSIKPILFVANDACQILLVVGHSRLYLWEMKNTSSLFHSKDPNLQGKWSHVSTGETNMPLPSSKDVVVDAVFFTNLVLGRCCSCSFVFNSGSSIQVSAVLLRWLNQSSLFSSSSATYSAEWTSLNTPLSSLGPSCSLLLRRGAFVVRHTNDGSTLAVAVNQRVPQNSKMMFISTMTSTAVVSDMKSCGCKSKNPPTMLARSYRVGSMEWTINSLFLVCITLRGSLCIFSRLGDLLVLQADGCSVELGPAYFLPFHPVVTLRTINSANGDDNSDMSEADPMKQRFSVTTHPSKPMILCSDGYLVTVLSLPDDLTCETSIEQYLTEAHQTLVKLNNQWQLGLTVNPLELKITKPAPSEMIVSPNQNNSHPFPSLKRSALFGFRKADTLNLTSDALDGHEKSALTASSDFSDYGKQFGSVNEGKIMFGTMDSIDGKLETTTDFNELLVLVKKAHRAILSAWGLGVSITDKWSVNLESLMQHTSQLIVLLMHVLMKCDGNLLRTDSTNMNSDFSKFGKRYPRILRVLLLFKCTMTLLHWDTLHKNLLPHVLKIIHEVLQSLLASNNGKKKHVKAFACLYRLLHYSESKLNTIYSYTRVVQQRFDFAHLERKFYESDLMESAVIQNVARHHDVERVVPVARLKAIATIQEILDQTKSLRGSLTRSMWHPGTRVACRHLPAKRLMMSWKLLHQKLASFYSELLSETKQTPQGSKAHKQLQKLCILLSFTQASLAKLGCSIPVIHNKKRSEPRRKIFLRGCESLMFAKQSAAIDLWHTSYIRTQALTQPDRRPSTSSLRHSVASDSLLAILYTYILNFDLVSAIEMVDSLVECYSLEETAMEEKVPKLTRAHVSFLFALMGGKQDDSSRPPVLPCVIEPAAKIAVSTLARFMAMYFCNQALYVYPPYNPQPLPRLDSTEKNINTRVISIYHDQISCAIRKSELSGILTVNLTLELLLICGLNLEAIWFAKQLGDWKSSLVLAVLAKEHQEALPKQSIKDIALPPDLHPLSIVKDNLLHIIQQSQYTAPQQQNASNNHKAAQYKMSPMRLLTPVKKSLSIASLTEADKALHEQLSRSIKEILTAATVAKLDITPWLLCKLMKKCLTMVAKFDRLVPDDFYLPAPPYFCPQPSLGIEMTYCEAVQEEYELRRETSDIIQLILLVLSASNCTMPCSRWYVQELMDAQEKLLDQDPDTTFDFPAMLASYTTCQVDLKALLLNSDPTQRSTKLLLQCFRDVCTIVWLLNVRDKLTMAVRKYQVIQDNLCSSLNTSITIQKKSANSVLLDIIQWSKFLHSFSFFLNMEDEVQDILLTAVSNLPPSKEVADILGEVFYSSKIVLPAVEEKFQRVMSKLRKMKEKADEPINKKEQPSTVTFEPLYVYYRKQCLKQKRLMISKSKILGSVEEQILGIYCTPYLRQSFNSPVKAVPSKTEETIEKQLSKASSFKVGARSFETNKIFLDFLETFFLVAFGKFESVIGHGIKRTDNIPLLRSYADEIRQHELSTLAFGVARPQHCFELSDAVLLRSQSFENMSKSFTLTRTETHDTDGCVQSKVKGLFRSKRSYYFKKCVPPSVELLSIKYKTDANKLEDLEKVERPVSRLSQKLPSGHKINQSFDDIRALSMVSSLSSGRVSRSSFAKLRASKGSLTLAFDGSKPFADVNVVPGAVFNEIVQLQQWMTRWSNKRLPFDIHTSSETSAIRVELPQQLMINCIWLIRNWYNLEKSRSCHINVSTDGKKTEVDQEKKNRRHGVALRPNLTEGDSTTNDKTSKSKMLRKKHSKISQSLEVRSNDFEAYVKNPADDEKEPESKNDKKKRRKLKKTSKHSSKSLDIHPVTSLVSVDVVKQTEKDEELEKIVKKKLQQMNSESDDMEEVDIKMNKSSHLRKQHKHEFSSQISLKSGEDETIPNGKKVSPVDPDKQDGDQHNILYRRSPLTGAVHTLTATHYYHSGEDSDSSTISLQEKDVAIPLSETDLWQRDAFERKHSIPQSPLISPCATMTRQHTDQAMGFRKLVRAELKKLLEAQHKNTMTMLDGSGSFSGDQHPLLAYNPNGIDEESAKTRSKHPSGRVYSTSGRSVKALLARRTTSPNLSPGSPESLPNLSRKQDVAPTKPSSKSSSKLFLTRSQSTDKNRTSSLSGSSSSSPSCNRNQNAVHSPEESDKSPDEVFSSILTSDESDKESRFQRDSFGRPLPLTGVRSPNPSQQVDRCLDQNNDVVKDAHSLRSEDIIKNQKVNGVNDVEQVDLEQHQSLRQDEIQGWPLLSFDVPGSKGGFQDHQNPHHIPTQHSTASKPFFLDRPPNGHFPHVAPKSAWHLQHIDQDPDINNEYVTEFPPLKLNSGQPFQHQNEELKFNFEPAKEVYSSIWIPPLLHLDKSPDNTQRQSWNEVQGWPLLSFDVPDGKGGAFFLDHQNYQNIPPLLQQPPASHHAHNNYNYDRETSFDRRPVEPNVYSSIWDPPLLHMDNAPEDQEEECNLSKHLQYFWANKKNIHSLKVKLRGEQPHEEDPLQHIGSKDEHPDKVSMPLLELPPMMNSDDSHSKRRRRRQRHRDSSKDNQDVSRQMSSSSCGSEVNKPKESKPKSQKQKRRKLPKEPSKKSKASEKKTKDKKKVKDDVMEEENETPTSNGTPNSNGTPRSNGTPTSNGTVIFPSEESESQPEDIVKKVKSKKKLPKKGSYDHLLEGRQEAYFPSSAEVHLKAVRGLQAKPVERVDAATMAVEMKNVGTSIDHDRVKLPEDDERMLVLDKDGKEINDAISAYTTAKTGLDNAGKILAPDIFFKLRFEGTTSNQATVADPHSEIPPLGRNFISVVDLEGSRLLDDIPQVSLTRNQPSPEITQHPRSPSPTMAAVHYSALRNRDAQPNIASPREVPEEDEPSGPDPLTKELLAARRRIKGEQFSKIQAISNEEREGYKNRMNMQLIEMDEQLKVIDEMSKQMQEELQGTNKLMKNVENITEFLTPEIQPTPKETQNLKIERPQKKVQTTEVLSDGKEDDKKRLAPTDEVDVETNDPTSLHVSEASEETEENNDTLSVIDTTVQDTNNTLGILGISGVSDIIAEVIADGDLNATDLGISKQQREAARQRVKRQQAKIDEEMEDLDFTSLNSKQIRELLKTPREEDDDKELWPSAVQPSKRTEEQKEELKEWTKKKREKAFEDYRSKLSELRETEKTPFKAKHTSTLLELKKTEIERKNKRKTKEEEDYDERVKHAKSLMDQLFTDQSEVKQVTDKVPDTRVKKVPPKTLAKPTRGSSSTKLRPPTTVVTRNVKSEDYENDKRGSRIDPHQYTKLRESFERGVPLRSSSAADGRSKRQPSLQMVMERKMLKELGKVSDPSSSSDDLDVSETDKENQPQAQPPVMYKPKPFTALVKVQRPSVTRKGQDVPRTAKTYTEILQDLKKGNAPPSKTSQSLKGQQRLYGTKRLPGTSKLTERQSPRHPKPYTKRLQETRKMSGRPVGMRSRTPIRPYSTGLTETVTLGDSRKQQVERRGLKAEAKPRVSTPYTERLSQLSMSGTFKPSEPVISPQPRLGLPYKPKESLGSTYVNRLKHVNEGATKGTYQAVYEPVPKGTYSAYKAPPLRTPSPRHHPYRGQRVYEDESVSAVSEGSPWSLPDSVKKILGDDDSMTGISAIGYQSDGDLYLDDQYSDYTTSVNIRELEEIASVNSGSFVSVEWDAIDKILADFK